MALPDATIPLTSPKQYIAAAGHAIASCRSSQSSRIRFKQRGIWIIPLNQYENEKIGYKRAHSSLHLYTLSNAHQRGQRDASANHVVLSREH